MKNIETEIIIDSSSENVWNVLTNFDTYPSWNSFITQISGKPTVGETLKVRISPPKGKPMTFKPEVLISEKNNEFRWIGKLLIKGIFDGEHYFKIKEISENKIKFIQGENFSGILVPFFGTVFKKTENGFKNMNQDLKKFVEKSNGSSQ